VVDITRTTLRFPDDSPAKMIQEAKLRGYPFRIFMMIARPWPRRIGLPAHPDFYVFDQQSKLVYRGQMIRGRPGNGIPVTGDDLRAALDAV